MSDCPICAPGWSDRALVELPMSYVVGGAGPSVLPGYSAVFAKRHVREPFELTEPERQAWWTDCMAVARATQEVFHPKKLNYEIHGNTIEHLHLHLFPRFSGDAFEARPIDPREPKRHTTAAGQVDELLRAIDRIRARV